MPAAACRGAHDVVDLECRQLAAFSRLRSCEILTRARRRVVRGVTADAADATCFTDGRAGCPVVVYGRFFPPSTGFERAPPGSSRG